MLRASVMLLLFFCGLCSPLLMAQVTPQSDLQAVLDKTERLVSLTDHGSPFHAEMKVSGTKTTSQYDGSMRVDWVAANRYRVEVRSATFHQIKTVDGDRVEERTEGDFYPGWLHSFVVALLDPLHAKHLLLGEHASLGSSQSSSGNSVKGCVNRNDRPGGITDEMTWGGVCIIAGPLLVTAYDFSSYMEFADYQPFGEKMVAHRYDTSTGSYEPLAGTLTALRALETAEGDAIHVSQATPEGRRIGFALISTKDEEARLETAKPFDWPTVREGKSEGYMIVHALTDVTGQVRETSKHNSDNPGLEEAGREAALGYKFKPMLVDGVPVEMEMPLVLHFTSKVVDPLPVLRGAELLKQIKGCSAKLVGDPRKYAGATPTHISVNEEGKLTGEGYGPKVDPGMPAVVITISDDVSSGRPHGLFLDCHFSPLVRNGVVTYYHGDLLVKRDR